MTIKSDHILKSTLHVSILNATQCRWLGIFNAVWAESGKLWLNLEWNLHFISVVHKTLY